jgi:putative ABC transport system ATP-binding protein
MLVLRDVGKTYQMGEVQVPVLHGVNLEILEGEITVVVGPSGSGKSTLLNMIGGIDTPTSGSVAFRGREVGDLDEAKLTDYRRQRIGFIFQFYNLIPTLNSVENVLVSTEICDKPLDPVETLKMVGLSHRLDHFPSQMSGGEQQRVAIARAVAKNPDLLLCDEPTGALDLTTGRHILEALVQLNTDLKKTIVIITHNQAIAGIGHLLVRIGSGTIESTARNPHRISASEVTW